MHKSTQVSIPTFFGRENPIKTFEKQRFIIVRNRKLDLQAKQILVIPDRRRIVFKDFGYLIRIGVFGHVVVGKKSLQIIPRKTRTMQAIEKQLAGLAFDSSQTLALPTNKIPIQQPLQQLNQIAITFGSGNHASGIF